jgi:hypothetical protein
MSLHTKSYRAANRRLARALSFLNRAGAQLKAASDVAPDRYHRNKLHGLSVGLRELSLPLARISSLLERGGNR